MCVLSHFKCIGDGPEKLVSDRASEHSSPGKVSNLVMMVLGLRVCILLNLSLVLFHVPSCALVAVYCTSNLLFPLASRILWILCCRPDFQAADDCGEDRDCQGGERGSSNPRCEGTCCCDEEVRPCWPEEWMIRREM